MHTIISSFSFPLFCTMSCSQNDSIVERLAWYITLLTYGAYFKARSTDITRGGANRIARISRGSANPTSSGLFTNIMVNRAATPAPSECPTIVSRYLQTLTPPESSSVQLCNHAIVRQNSEPPQCSFGQSLRKDLIPQHSHIVRSQISRSLPFVGSELLLQNGSHMFRRPLGSFGHTMMHKALLIWLQANSQRTFNRVPLNHRPSSLTKIMHPIRAYHF